MDNCHWLNATVPTLIYPGYFWIFHNWDELLQTPITLWLKTKSSVKRETINIGRLKENQSF